MAAETDQSLGPKWLLPSALALMVLLAGFLLLRGSSSEKQAGTPASPSRVPDSGSATPPPPPATSVPATPVAPATPTPEPTPSPEPKIALTDIALPGGAVLKGAASGIESELVAFIQTKPVDQTTWFTFDRLRFETSKPVLKPEALPQLENIAVILKAFPKVHLKIGGFTDNLGSADANKKLSDERAQAVLKALTEHGVEKARLEAEGFGGENPVGDNATEAGRAQNRRIAVRVVQK